MIITVIMSSLHLACAPQKETRARMMLQVARDRSWTAMNEEMSVGTARDERANGVSSSHRCFARIGAIFRSAGSLPLPSQANLI